MSRKNTIDIPRGTSQKIAVKISNPDGTPYQHSDTDIVRLGVKQDRYESECLIEKTGTYDTENDRYVFSFVPADTAELPFDRYQYDIGVQTKDEDYLMVIRSSTFNVTTAISGIKEE